MEDQYSCTRFHKRILQGANQVLKSVSLFNYFSKHTAMCTNWQQSSIQMIDSASFACVCRSDVSQENWTCAQISKITFEISTIWEFSLYFLCPDHVTPPPLPAACLDTWLALSTTVPCLPNASLHSPLSPSCDWLLQVRGLQVSQVPVSLFCVDKLPLTSYVHSLTHSYTETCLSRSLSLSLNLPHVASHLQQGLQVR